MIGNGGAGGNISSVIIDGNGMQLLVDQVFNRFLAGNGGDSFGAAGGIGGTITSLKTTSIGTSTAVAAGAGGDGLLKGGVGGSLSKIEANAKGDAGNALYKVLGIAGAGGDAYAFTAASIFSPLSSSFEKATAAFGGALGVGGNGGSINGFTQPATIETRTDLIAGNGGSTINHGTAVPGAKFYVGKGGSVSNVNLAGYAGAASNADESVPIVSYNSVGTLAQFVADKLLSDPTVQLGTLGNVGVVVGAAGNVAGGLASSGSLNGSVANFSARGVMSMVAGSVDKIASIVSISELTINSSIAGSFKNAPHVHSPSAPYYYTPNGDPSSSPVLGGKLMDGAIVAKKYTSSPTGPRVFTM